MCCFGLDVVVCLCYGLCFCGDCLVCLLSVVILFGLLLLVCFGLCFVWVWVGELFCVPCLLIVLL